MHEVALPCQSSKRYVSVKLVMRLGDFNNFSSPLILLHGVHLQDGLADFCMQLLCEFVNHPENKWRDDILQQCQTRSKAKIMRT